MGSGAIKWHVHCLYAEHLLKRAHKAIQKWSAKNVAVHWRYL